MKNTSHSQLFYPSNFCSRLNKKPLLLLLFGVFLLASNLAHAQLPQFDNFESGFGNWNDGGGDCRRDNNGRINGNDTVELRDNSGNASSMTSDPLDLTTYNDVTIEFLYIVSSFEGSEDFFVEYDDGTGGGFVVIGNYVRNVDFVNGIESSVTITLNSPIFNLSNNARFRIRADASGNGDFLFIDDVNITGSSTICSEPTNQPTNLSFNNVTESSINGSFNAATSAPDNYLVIYSTSNIAPLPSDTTVYNIGDTVGGYFVADNDNDTTFSVSSLDPNTTYYFYVFSFNENCSNGPEYNNINPLTDSETTEFYCTPS